MISERAPASHWIVQHSGSADFHSISYWKTQSVHSDGNMRPPTVSNVYPEGDHYFVMWYIQMPTCNNPPQDGLFTVFCEWTLLFHINTLDMSRARINVVHTDQSWLCLCGMRKTVLSFEWRVLFWNFEFCFHEKRCIFTSRSQPDTTLWVD